MLIPAIHTLGGQSLIQTQNLWYINQPKFIPNPLEAGTVDRSSCFDYVDTSNPHLGRTIVDTTPKPIVYQSTQINSESSRSRDRRSKLPLRLFRYIQLVDYGKYR